MAMTCLKEMWVNEMKSCSYLQNIIKSVYNPEKYVFMTWTCILSNKW